MNIPHNASRPKNELFLKRPSGITTPVTTSHVIIFLRYARTAGASHRAISTLRDGLYIGRTGVGLRDIVARVDSAAGRG